MGRAGLSRRSRVWIVAAAAVAAAVAVPLPAWADEAGSSAGGETLFPWADLTGGIDANWKVGLARFVLGLMGALVTVYTLNGELLPAMGGRTRIRAAETELEEVKRQCDVAVARRTQLAREDPSSAEVGVLERLTTDLDAQAARLSGDITSERRRALAIGIPLYVLLGGFFACALATTRAQAIAVGFGWTASLQSVGLRREKEAVKTEASGEVVALKKERDLAVARSEELRGREEKLNAAVTMLGERLVKLLQGAGSTPAAPMETAGPEPRSGKGKPEPGEKAAPRRAPSATGRAGR
jgi:hypothetical protein